jgi:hypothetical protein
VYGFLFAYQDSQSYKDFRALWTEGQTSVLAKYEVAAVPESSTALMTLTGLGLLGAAVRRRTRVA